MNDRHARAYHESGHAIFALSQAGEVEWLSCDGTITDKKGRRRRFTDDEGHLLNGICFYVLADDLRDRLEIRLAGILAGIEAELAVAGETNHAGEMITALELAIEELLTEDEAHAICRWCAEWLSGLFSRHAVALEALTAALLQDGELTGAAVAEVIAGAGGVTLCPLPTWADVRLDALATHGGQPFFALE